MKHIGLLALVLFALILNAPTAHTHPGHGPDSISKTKGGTDKQNCHWDKKSGTRHCH